MTRTPPPNTIARAAQAAGRSWADDVRISLRADGRDVGMWPGTLSEARALAARISGKHTPTPEEQEQIARAVYAAARSFWNANRSEERDDDVDRAGE